MSARELQAISLYTGVGGLDFGFEAAGFHTAVAVEMDATACRTVRLNRPDWGLIEGDIHDVDSDRILTTAGLKPGQADILIGGPPCQPFSKSSYWVKGDSPRLDDPRADTLTAYLRVLRDTRPRAFLLENVYGLVYKGKDEGMRHLLDGIQAINLEVGTNYTVAWKMLNAAHYGVPQIRERVFLIGSRDGLTFKFPAPTHESRAEAGLLDDREPFRTAWDAIGDLPANPNEPSLDVGGKWGSLAAHHPGGTELPFPYESRTRRTSVRMAHALLELSPQACEGPTVLDDSGAAGIGDRSVSLAQSQAKHPRAVSAPNLSGQFNLRLWTHGGAEDDR